jgi:predicted TIM-barrel fold metal-dependent hydrolase
VAKVDLSHAEVIDAHVHPYRLDDLLARHSRGFDARITFIGESFASSSKLGPELWPRAEELADSTVLALGLRRWLAEHLHCDPTREAVTAARDDALRADPVAYTRALLEAERIVGILSDDGYPQPSILPDEFEASVGAPVYRVARLEPWILLHRDGSFDDLVSGVAHEATEAASDPRCVAYKSIIAYRSGLDVGNPSAREAEEAFQRWRAEGWPDGRGSGKRVRDFLLRRALSESKRHDRPFHIHCGAGDPDIDLVHARPEGLFRLLVDHQDQPIVLIHAGYPWVVETAYMASVLPNVHLEISELVPWGLGMLDSGLEALLGTAPAAKVLYGSDEAGEPEAFWVAARLARAALTRVLEAFVDRDYVTGAEADRMGRQVLAENARRLHGIAGR